jgi:hypothetical protein
MIWYNTSSSWREPKEQHGVMVSKESSLSPAKGSIKNTTIVIAHHLDLALEVRLSIFSKPNGVTTPVFRQTQEGDAYTNSQKSAP